MPLTSQQAVPVRLWPSEHSANSWKLDAIARGPCQFAQAGTSGAAEQMDILELRFNLWIFRGQMCAKLCQNLSLKVSNNTIGGKTAKRFFTALSVHGISDSNGRPITRLPQRVPPRRPYPTEETENYQLTITLR
ncbi:hypothetical protein PtA15_5A681 [Puccinia triticina]|uniref:Uncharacterized protein n=1 Tax=Puccinia triticina TaxID=208348 RepID=A0ABY7CQU9_9BASI|nr:uncharacterized protein PtA15_5A681 [Puccinia triticina]WAQ85107.1 hypothetical protein PtA15_5A681 [Puccinia triticina]